MQFTIKQVANRYEIISLIGQGGMADVYKSKDTILNRIVAIKILREKMSEDAMTLVRFQREASAASKLSHPNVVDIYDVGEYEGMHYIVMEYVRGKTLKQLIQQRGALSVSESLHIMIQLTSAIQNAHSHNIIHRDIKPQNVLVKDDGTVKITDFGIAVANDAVQLTMNNTVMGSAHYLAPETAQGKDATQHVDIYSLGIVFYELLTGDVPFHGKTPTEIAVKHLREPVRYVRDYNPSIPQAVENIILRATAKNTEDRYQDAQTMLYDLEHCMNWNYRNVDRVHFEIKPIASVNVTDGHVEVEYSDEPVEPEHKPRRKRNGFSYWILLFIVLLLAALIVLGSIAAGIIRIDGFMGYEKVPNVSDLTRSQAKTALEKDHFTNITFKRVVSDSVEKGNVVETNFKPGDVIKSDVEIVVSISKGPSYLIKDYTGQYVKDVENEFADDDLSVRVKIRYQSSASKNPGIILKQKKLKPGDRIDPDSTAEILFIVAKSPTVKITKDLIGMDVEDAKEKLNEQGIAVVLSGINGDNTQSGVVVDVDPPVGSTYTQEGSDSVVTLYYE